jgi:tetratricopeptide (TPR) repeat protein
LEQSGEAGTWRDRHLDLFLMRVEVAAPKLTGAYQQLWLNWLTDEHDNLRAALAWSLESSRIESGLRIVIALVPFWEIRGYMRECQTWYQRLLAQTDDMISLDIRVKALVNAAYMAMAEGNIQASTAYGREAIQAAEAGGDNDLLSFVLNFLGASAQAAGDHQTAFTVLERAIPIYRQSGPSYHLRMAHYLSGENAVESGLNMCLLMARDYFHSCGLIPDPTRSPRLHYSPHRTSGPSYR